jgi:L-cysteine/cystine lyase
MDKLAALRQELPALTHLAYLNTGTASPLPRGAAQAIAAEAERQVLQGRSNFRFYTEEYYPLLARLRARFARLLNADDDEIALTHHTTEGMNIAVWGLRWQAGDEILTTTAEHEGGFMPVYAAAQRFGLRLRVVDIGLGEGDDLAEKIIAAITPRTRLIVTSHVMWKTGAILPVAPIAEAAHRMGALVAVDGAQAAGAIPVDVRALGADFYAVSGQKWLCGPEGTGAVYVRRECMSELAPTFAGYLTLNHDVPVTADNFGYFLPARGASRFEVATLYLPALYGLDESLRWMEESVEYAWAFERSQAMAKHCRAKLAELPGLTLYVPAQAAPLTTFILPGLDPLTAPTALYDRGVVIRAVPRSNRFRVSTAFFNNEEDVARLCESLVALANM